MKLESVNFWFIVLRISVSRSVCQIMDLGTPCFHLLGTLKCSLSLSSEQRKVSSDFLNTKVFWSENFGLLSNKSVHGRPDSPSWYTDSWLPAAFVVGPLVYRERNTHAMLYKCGSVRRLKRGKSGLQILPLTGGTHLPLSSSLTNNGKNGKLFFLLFLFCFLFPFLFYIKHDVNIN